MTATFVPPGLLPRHPDPGNPDAPAADPVANRAARQRAVNLLNLVGTAPEERFDRLTRLAMHVFGVDKALVALADGDRLWLKSEQGVGERSFPLKDTMCRRVVEAGDAARPLIVTDAAADATYADVAGVTSGDFRFYAGSPLRDANGIVVGTFCVADTAPRELTPAERALLDELAGWAQHELTRSAENDRAREVQQRLMPVPGLVLPGYDVAAACVPTQSVGGDFYDWEVVDEGIAFVLADVMGKGAAAAIMSANVRAAFRSGLRRDLELRAAGDTRPRVDRVLRHVADVLDRDLATTSMIATAFAGMLYRREHALTWVDAGHGLAVVVSSDGTARWLQGDDLPLGVTADYTWRQHHVALAPGDTVAVFSDGLLDLVGGGADALPYLAELVRRAGSPAEIVVQVQGLTEIGIAGDDVTVVALRRQA